MAFKLPGRVYESFTTTGTGTITLGGAVSGYRTFAAAMSNADTTHYFMFGGSDWEEGYGTYSGGTLARTTVLGSSNGGSAVSWAAGTKYVGVGLLGLSDLDATNKHRLVGALFGGQLQFPATQDPSSDANNLDDYEEGTFTPSAAFATPGNSSWSFGTQLGYYIKIGRLVGVIMDYSMTPTIGTGSGNLNFSGLPFAPDTAGFLAVGLTNNQWTWPASRTQLYGGLSSGSTSWVLQGMGSAQAASTLGAGNMTSGGAHTVRFQGIYRTAS